MKKGVSVEVMQKKRPYQFTEEEQLGHFDFQKAIKIMNHPKPTFQVNNVVGDCVLDCSLNKEFLLKFMPSTTETPEHKFDALIHEHNGTKATIYPAPRCLVTGGKLCAKIFLPGQSSVELLKQGLLNHIKQIMLTYKLYANVYMETFGKDVGPIPEKITNFHINNMVANGDLGCCISLTKFVEAYSDQCEQTQESPSVTFKPYKDRNIKCLVFKKKYVIVGGKSEEELRQVFGMLIEYVSPFQMEEYGEKEVKLKTTSRKRGRKQKVPF